MNRKAALFASATLGVAFLSACSDSPTAPSKASAFVPKLSFDVGDLTDDTPQLGVVKVCKVGNAGGSFDVSRVAIGGSTGTVSGDNTLIDTGECKIVAEDQSGSDVGSEVSVSEDAAANTVSEVTGCVFIGDPGGVDANPCDFTATSRFINQFHGYVITYTNTFTPPPPPSGCTFTKGWYQSKNATLTGVDGLTTTVEAAFFAATPNKTGTVSFVGPNNLLNLYQQLLAALENGGAGGPQAVQDAISDAQDGTTVSAGGQLTTTLTNTEISALIVTLSAFNEGTFPLWPHC